MNKKLSYVCIRAQRVKGSALPVSIEDYIQVLEFDIEYVQYVNNVPVLTGVMSSEPEPTGNSYATCKGVIPFVSSGQVSPECEIILRAAGFTASVSGDEFIFTRSGDYIDVSICKYNNTGSQSRIRSVNSVVFTSIKIIIESGKIPVMQFAGQGLIGGVDSTVLDTVGLSEVPEAEKIPYYTCGDVEASLLDTNWSPSKIEIEFINKVVHKPLM